MSKPVLTFPYHDPHGSNNLLLEKTLPVLQELFATICISATPASVEGNDHFLQFLESEGCKIHRNEEGTRVGDHYRNAVRLAVQHGESHVFFAMIDRLLFALNTGHAEECAVHIQEADQREITLYERTEYAWSIHPENYREIEQAANQMGKYVLGKEIELGTCGMSFSYQIATQILAESVAPSFSAGTEWILLFFLWGYDPYRKQCDWLAWEDPFIEGKDAILLKHEREQDPQEVMKRIRMNADFVELLNSDRFLQPLLERKK